MESAFFWNFKRKLISIGKSTTKPAQRNCSTTIGHSKSISQLLFLEFEANRNQFTWCLLKVLTDTLACDRHNYSCVVKSQWENYFSLQQYPGWLQKQTYQKEKWVNLKSVKNMTLLALAKVNIVKLIVYLSQLVLILY